MKLQELELLDLRRLHTVSEIVDGMSRCSFGARMLGEAAATLASWIGEPKKPLIVYDGRPDTPLGQLLKQMAGRGWFAGVRTPEEYSGGGKVLVVGGFSERHEDALFRGPERAIFINPWGRAKPGQVRDGWFPDAVFADPRYIMPLLSRVLEERSGGARSTVADFLEGLETYGGVAAEAAAGARTFREMVADPACTVFFTVSGAMTIAKMGLVICDMIDEGMVQAVASTGALMAHGLVESVGLKHYKYDPSADDAELAARKINRVTDTLEPEANLDHIENVLGGILDGWTSDQPLTPVVLNRMIGEHLERCYPKERAILKSAFVKKVPVFVPAFVDSEIGNDVFVHNRKREEQGRKPLLMDLERDTQTLMEIASGAERAGIFTVGGGVPRNNVQNVAPLIEILNERMGWSLPMSKFRYGCRICPDAMHFGHLSGCTYSEGMSWRKMDPHGRFAEVRADATQVWPFWVKYVMSR